MRFRIAYSIVAVSTLFIAPLALAASIRVRESASTSVRSDESGTVTVVEEQRVEEYDSDQASDVEASGTTAIRSRESLPAIRRRETSFRRTCGITNNGEARCEEASSGTRPSPSAASVQLRVDGREWWTSWQPRVLEETTRAAASDSDDADVARMLSRAEARIVRRVCSRLAGNERTECLEDAIDGEGSTMRLRLRDWIGRASSL